MQKFNLFTLISPHRSLLVAFFVILMGISTSPSQAQFGSGIEPIVENAYTENATAAVTDSENAFTTLELFISNMLALGTTVGSIIFIVYFLLGAITWIGAGGDTSKINKARDQMIQGAIGLIVLVSLYAVIGLIGTIVGLRILNPAEVLTELVPT